MWSEPARCFVPLYFSIFNSTFFFCIEEKRSREFFFFGQGQTRQQSTIQHSSKNPIIQRGTKGTKPRATKTPNTTPTTALLFWDFVLFLVFCFGSFFGVERTKRTGVCTRAWGEDKRCRFWRGRFWANFRQFWYSRQKKMSCHVTRPVVRILRA